MNAYAGDFDYEAQVSNLLFELLIEVARRHAPEVVPQLEGTASTAGAAPALLAR